MGEPQVESISERLARGNNEYGDAISRTNHVLEEVNIIPLQKSGLFFQWIMILNKLMRLIHNPRHLDSWLDIASYAEDARRRCVDDIPRA